MCIFQAGDTILPLGRKTYVMGILNVTPDSFSDGGRYVDPQDAAEHALRMQEQGADIIDVGGQSTRPGYKKIGWEEEWSRLSPVLERLEGRLEIPVSVDTFYPQVAERALACGVSIINDITGFADERMFELATHTECGCILMHSGAAQVGQTIIETIRSFFEEQYRKAEAYGIDASRLCFDPGVGFGKTNEENLEILRCTKDLCFRECALLMAASRKRVIGSACSNPPFEQRLYGTIAAHTIAITGGADMIRVHDLPEAVQAAKVADAILRGGKA